MWLLAAILSPLAITPAPSAAQSTDVSAAALQTPSRALEGLPAELVERIRDTVTESARDSLPLEPLRAKALEGVAKGVPYDRIGMAVRSLARELGSVRDALRVALPGTRLRAGEITSATMAVRNGVDPQRLSVLWGGRPADSRSLEIPLAVTAELVRRGIETDQALALMQHLVQSDTPAGTAAQLPARLDMMMQGPGGTGEPQGALVRALRSLGIPDPANGLPGAGLRRPGGAGGPGGTGAPGGTP
jgi:hypothetical protein